MRGVSGAIPRPPRALPFRLRRRAAGRERARRRCRAVDGSIARALWPAIGRRCMRQHCRGVSVLGGPTVLPQRLADGGLGCHHRDWLMVG